jgi:hypothetical protein
MTSSPPQQEHSPQREFFRSVALFQSGKIFERVLGRFVVIVALSFTFAISASGAVYYCDYSAGADSNSGTSKSSPWKRQPYMAGFSGSYSHAAGDQFIFKGGVTWAAACFPMNIAAGGSGSTNDYYGVDTTWFTGSAWTKPVFDGNYAVSGIVGIISNVTLDNLELRHVASSASDGWGLVAVNTGSSANTLIENCFLHGWKETGGTDGAHGGYYAGSYTASTITTNVIQNTEISNLESPNNGTAVRFGGKLIGCKIHDNSSAVLFCTELTNSQIYNINGNPFDGEYHPNGCYLDSATLGQTVGYIRGCIFHDVTGGANMAYLNGRFATQYCYNNLFYGVLPGQRPIEIDAYDYGANAVSGNYYIWNNTFDCSSDGGDAMRVVPRSPSVPILIQVQNNQVIGGSLGSASGDGSGVSVIVDHNLTETKAQGTTAGYTTANFYVSTGATSPTVDAGESTPSKIFTTDILGVSRPQGAAWDIGAYEFLATPPAPQNLRVSP